MRKPPRPTTLILGLVLIVAAIWRLQTCASSGSADVPAWLTSPPATPTSSAKP